MPTSVVNGDYAEVRYCCYTPTQISLNICHYRLDITAGTWTDQEVVSAMTLIVANIYKSNMPNEASFRGVGLRLQVLPVPTEVFDVSQDGAGTAAGDLSATQVSGLITKRTARAGRKYRGRLYVGFPSALDIDSNGVPTPAYVAGIQTLGNTLGPVMALVNGANTMEAVMRVRSTLVPGAPTYEPVVALTSRNRFGTQRSRGAYGAPNIPPW